jgi:hypothetical protein
MKVKLWLKRYNVRFYLFIYGPIRHATIVVFFWSMYYPLIIF